MQRPMHVWCQLSCQNFLPLVLLLLHLVSHTSISGTDAWRHVVTLYSAQNQLAEGQSQSCQQRIAQAFKARHSFRFTVEVGYETKLYRSGKYPLNGAQDQSAEAQSQSCQQSIAQACKASQIAMQSSVLFDDPQSDSAGMWHVCYGAYLIQHTLQH